MFKKCFRKILNIFSILATCYACAFKKRQRIQRISSQLQNELESIGQEVQNVIDSTNERRC